MEMTASKISVQLGVPENQIRQATELYCEALHEKLLPFLGPVARATAFLTQGIAEDRAFVALEEGQVVGIAGFKLADRGLFEPSYDQFLLEYGWTAPFRLLGLALLERKEEADCLVMDGIAVKRCARGKGIGTRLLAALGEHARTLGKSSLRLDVVDTNPGAKALYERLGFVAKRTEDIGPLRLVLPFRRATEMRKRVNSANRAL